MEPMSHIEELNRLAVAKGFLAPEGKSARYDFSDKLGEELSLLESRCYGFIHQQSFNGTVNAKQICREIYGIKSPRLKHYSKAWTLICRVREKLGKEAIITRDDGYISRRALNSAPQK